MIASLLISPLLLASSGGSNPITWNETQNDVALWTAVVFIVLLVVLWKFAWKPIAEGLDKREKQIADHIAETHRNHDETRQLLADYEQKLAASQGEVRGILDLARRDGEKLSREIVEKAKNEAREEQQRAVQQIEAATTGALAELAQRSATLAVELAGKIVHAELTPKNHADLIQKAVSEFTNKN